MTARRGRSVTAVVVDGTGRVRGALAPRPVEMPWWQEVGPIVDAIPGATVLRLLDATPAPDGPMGGSVTYLVQVDDVTDLGFDLDVADLDLEPWSGALEDHRLRHPWARPGGPEADHRWVAEQVTVTGAPRQHRTWNLSAIWSYPTTTGTVWLKCIPEFFAHEAAVIELLAGEAVPVVLAAEGHRILLADMAGRDGHDASEEERLAMIDALVELQVRATDRVDDLLDRGVPDLRAAPLGSALADLVERLAPPGDPRRGPLSALVDELPDRLATVDACGPPPTLVHGDAHGGNCRFGAGVPLWFDWGDSCIASPLLDLICRWDKSAAVWRHWLARWEERAPGSAEAWEALGPVAELRQAWVYQRFLDGIEPSERVYHRDDVPIALDAAIGSFSQTR